MIISIPSIVLRKIMRKGPVRQLNGIREVSLSGKISRRTRETFILLDSFCGIHIQTQISHIELIEGIDRSIREDYPVFVVCALERIPRVRLRLKSIRKCSFHEEMYRTLEAIEYWRKVQSQKQPK